MKALSDNQGMKTQAIWRNANGVVSGRAAYSVVGERGAELAQALASLPVCEDGDGGLTTRMAVLRLATRRYCLPLRDRVEVLSPSRITLVSDAPRWFAGTLDRQAGVVPVVDLRKRLGLPRRAPGTLVPVVVADWGEDAVSVIADEVIEVITIPNSWMRVPTGHIGEGQAVCGTAYVGGAWIPVLDRGRLRRECEAALSNVGPSDLRPARIRRSLIAWEEAAETSGQLVWAACLAQRLAEGAEVG